MHRKVSWSDKNYSKLLFILILTYILNSKHTPKKVYFLCIYKMFYFFTAWTPGNCASRVQWPLPSMRSTTAQIFCRGSHLVIKSMIRAPHHPWLCRWRSSLQMTLCLCIKTLKCVRNREGCWQLLVILDQLNPSAYHESSGPLIFHKYLFYYGELLSLSFVKIHFNL